MPLRTVPSNPPICRLLNVISDSLKNAVNCLALADIVLASISGEVGENYVVGEDIPGLKLQTFSPRTAAVRVFADDEDSSAPRRIQYRVNAGARLVLPDDGGDVPEQQEPEVVARVETSFLVTYVEKVGAELSDEAIDEFAQHNVPFNVWPYWREVVHASFSRMGLPRVVLPLYRMKRIQSKSVGRVAEEGKADVTQG